MSRGEFVWYDYMATDVDKAIAFYGEVLGYKSQPWGEGENPYKMLMVGGMAIGGVMELPEQAAEMGAPPHWLAYVSVPDIDATAERAEELGGELLNGPFDIPTVGRVAIMRDPYGAVFAGFTVAEGDDPKQPGVETPGAFSWSELMTEDFEGGFDFYSELFGWTRGEAMERGPVGTYQIFECGGRSVGGMMDRPEGMPMSAWLYYVTTDDVEAAMTRAEGNGGQKMMGPMDVPGGRIAVFTDPQGAAFGLFQHDN